MNFYILMRYKAFGNSVQINENNFKKMPHSMQQKSTTNIAPYVTKKHTVTNIGSIYAPFAMGPLSFSN